MALDHAGRFGVFAMLPLPHLEESLQEIRYAFDTLHVDGVGILTSYDNRWLGYPYFEPLWEELNRRQAVVYVHPTVAGCCAVQAVPDFITEVGVDTTRSIASVILSGTSQKFPDIKWIWSHGGGVLTAVAERLLIQTVNSPPYKGRITRDAIAAELNRFFYDTAQISGSVTLDALTKLVPISQIVYGTDSPFRSTAEQTRNLTAFFKKGDLEKVERENALRLFPQFRPTFG
jgi:predicted TIM-barrel fold metal-dependent hydrolase